MAYNFPDNPTLGQVFEKWTWSGSAWQLTPPVNYSASEADARFVNVDGDTMTGLLELSADPVTAMHAATRQFVLASVPPAFPTGTVMIFYQSAAPTGWTKLTTQNDKALRVVSGTGGVAGGTNAFSTVMAQTVVGNTTLSAANVPNLNVSVSGTVTVYPSANGGYYFPMGTTSWGGDDSWSSSQLSRYYAFSNNNSVTYTNYQQAGNSMSGATNSASGGAHNHPITMAMQYIDVILASKA